MRQLDRYVLSNFLVPFAYCFLGFIAIWLVFELNDDGRDFVEAKVPVAEIALFYATQLPQIVLLSLPVGLLLALLFALSRMSRSNEIISMLSAGVSIPRIIAPLLACGLVATAVNFWLSYDLAPRSEATRKERLEQMTRGKSKFKSLGGQLFRNRADRRLWYVQSMSLVENELKQVHIVQEDAEGNIAVRYYARRAYFSPDTAEWRLRDGLETRFDKTGDIISREDWQGESRIFEGWSETPYRIASAAFDPQTMGVTDLDKFLAENADQPEKQLAPFRTHREYRLAVPWQCLIAVIIAASLGIVNTRRGVLAGVASSIFIFFGVIFLEKLFLALGGGGRLGPRVAAWAPNVFFFALGLFLLYLRANNRDLPSLFQKLIRR